MASDHWKRLFHRLGMSTENAMDVVMARAREKLHPEVYLHVIAFRGFGTRLTEGWQGSISGRVLRYRQPSLPGTSVLWNNLRASYERFATDELPGITVSGCVDSVQVDSITDDEGYFRLDFNMRETGDASNTVPVQITLPGFTTLQIDGDPIINLPDTSAHFGVISDIDDTLLITNATSMQRMMRLTLLESAASRLAFDGVAEFYQALHMGRNPFFYVSSSPWNLYEFLTDFMRLNNIVPGPLMLRDFGIDETKFIAESHHQHKLEQIRSVIDLYPTLEFILCGDSGQDDPEIYATIAQEYPDQIRAIYVRDVSDQWRNASIQLLIQQLKEKNVDMLLVPDSLSAAAHAMAHGFISKTTLPAIEQAVRGQKATNQP
jgi:phosphatidate phosphatase APP1